ncbi:hypothetical protein [Tunturiibacter gelidiferens]|uniref:hypothetical protein n=1 Tax=Tunturiibacter gelidiferens TaxID=3069689 RepID=UPI003D9BCEFE
MTEEKLNLFEFASGLMAEAGASATKIVGCQMVNADSLAYRFTAYQTTSVVTPSSCRVPFFEIRLNTLPSVTPVSWIQTSMRPLHHAGAGTVRSRPPFPTISTITQWLSLNCS